MKETHRKIDDLIEHFPTILYILAILWLFSSQMVSQASESTPPLFCITPFYETNVNIRVSPNINSQVVHVLENEEIVPLLSYGNNGQWHQIEKGYVHPGVTLVIPCQDRESIYLKRVKDNEILEMCPNTTSHGSLIIVTDILPEKSWITFKQLEQIEKLLLTQLATKPENQPHFLAFYETDEQLIPFLNGNKTLIENVSNLNGLHISYTKWGNCQFDPPQDSNHHHVKLALVQIIDRPTTIGLILHELSHANGSVHGNELGYYRSTAFWEEIGRNASSNNCYVYNNYDATAYHLCQEISAIVNDSTT